MDYRTFIRLVFINIRSSIKCNNMKKILPINSNEFKIIYINEARIVLIKDEKYKDVWANNGFFLCEDIIEAICYLYDITYVNKTIQELVKLKKEKVKKIDL